MGILGPVWCLIVSIPDLCPLFYFVKCEDKLKTLGLPSSEYCREKFDMIPIYKIMRGIDRVD